MKPRAAIVGAGLMGYWHAHACRRAGGQVAAVIDVDPAAAGRLAKGQDSGAVVAASLDEIASVPIDVVHVCTPSASHVGVIRSAIARGAPAIVEKPLAADAATTADLIHAASRQGVWLLPVHQTVFQTGVQRAIQWAGRQTLCAFDYRACSAGAATAERQDAVAAEILPHPLSLLAAFVADRKDDERPPAIDWDVRHPRAGELVVTGIAGTMAVRILVSMHARPTRHDLTLMGEGGTMVMDLFHGFATAESRRAPTRRWKLAQPFAAAAGLTMNASLNLARRAAAGEPAYPGLNQLVARAYRALVDPVSRPLTDRHTLLVAGMRDEILRRAARV